VPRRSRGPGDLLPEALVTGDEDFTNMKRVDLLGVNGIYVMEIPSGQRLHHELERSTIFNGKIHYFHDHVQ